MASSVIWAALIGFATTGGALAQSRPENPSPAAVPTPVPMVLNGDDARRVAALEKTIDELRTKGRLIDAVAPAREVLEIRLKALGEDHIETENGYQNLASILETLRRPAEAAPLRREALKIRLKRVLNDDVAMIAFCLDAVKLQQRVGNFAAAESLTHIALERCRSIERAEGLETAQLFTTLALRLENEGHGSDAEFPLRQALAIQRRILPADDTRTADTSFHLARVLHLEGKEDEAERLCRTAIQIGGRHPAELNPRMADYHELLASCLKSRGGAAEAEAESKRASAARNGQPSPAPKDPAVRILQINRPDRGIAPAGRGAVDGPGQVAGQARRWVAVTEFEPPSAEKPGSTAGHVLHLEKIQAQLPVDAALVAWLDRSGPEGVPAPPREHWACVVRRRGEPAWIRINGGGPNQEWTDEDDRGLEQFRAVLSRRPEDHAGRWRIAAGAVARQWLSPLKPHLASTDGLPVANRLIVVSSPSLSGVPIETLVGSRADGRPEYIISYAPSAQIFVMLSQRPRANGGSSRPPRLLALGDPNFAAPEDARPRSPIASAVRREVAAIHDSPWGETPGPLPGTRREVLAIARLFDRPETLLGSEASEQRLEELVRSGRLREFDFIHLATHGKLDRRDARDSGLLLARDRLSDPLTQILAGREVYDGELSAEQVFHTWALNAELVTLSACWSGLGRPSGRSGPLGLSGALIRAGARGVVMSLWNVDDAATELLMTRFYQNLLGRRDGLDRPLPKAEALAEAKQWLRGLSAEDVDRHGARLPSVERLDKVAGPPRAVAKTARPYDHPYYWAAFILNGGIN